MTTATREDNKQYRIISACHSITQLMRNRYNEDISTEFSDMDNTSIRFYKSNYHAWHMTELAHIIDICRTLDLLCYIDTTRFVNDQWVDNPRMFLEVFVPIRHLR